MYSDISSNKRRTWVLIAIMSVIVIGLSWFIGMLYGLDIESSIILGTMIATIYSLISYYGSASIALSVSGAKPIVKAQAPDLYNVVENLCIANGQKTPEIYIIDDASPNAFATGRDPEHASIAFTTGILALLTREELEGVAAHELSHVKNYDIRVMTIVVVLVGLISLIADILIHVRIGKNDNKGGNIGLILMIVGIVLAILSPLFAQLIQLAISRSREYLADASGALLTRYPEGLASALTKIEAHGVPMKNANHATAHLFLSNPFGAKKESRSWFANMFSTHPPMHDRITRLRNMGR
ncbi:MAG: M48 family metallopeptidase [Patescibacteria group bacterium]